MKKPRQKAWVKYRRRALAAELQAEVLRAAFHRATGFRYETWVFMEGIKLYSDNPRTNIVITGVSVPTDYPENCITV